MSSLVRFSDITKNSSIQSKSVGIVTTQTQSIQTNSAGTDPPKRPERGVQTEQQLLWNSTAAKTIRIDPAVVEVILQELDRAEREEALFGAYKRRKWGNGMGRRKIDRNGGMVASIRLIKKLDLPMIDSPSPTASLLSIRCGPGQRAAILIGERQHDSAWCAEHIGSQLILVHRQLIISIPLAVCPSQVLFGRHGELLILGLQSGEIQLISFSTGSIGELLWTSGGVFHKMAITKMEWAIGEAADSVLLISIGLDGKMIKSRLEPINRLEPILSVQIGLADLPMKIHRKRAENGGHIGLVDFIQIGDRLFVGTETGALLELDSPGFSVKNAMELSENGGEGGIEQIGTFKVENWERHLVWRTSDGRIRRRKMPGTEKQEGDSAGMGQLLPIGLSKNSEFFIFKSNAPNLNMLILLCDTPSTENEGGTQLIGWDLGNDEFVLREIDFGNQFEGISLASNNQYSLLTISGDLFVHKNSRSKAAAAPQLNYFKINIEEQQ